MRAAYYFSGDSSIFPRCLSPFFLIDKLVCPLVNAHQMNVASRIVHQTPLSQKIRYQLLCHIVDYCHERHTEQHARESPQPAKYQNGKYHPEGTKPSRIAEDLRSDNIAVDLLENKDENEKVHSCSGFCNTTIRNDGIAPINGPKTE